MVDSKSTIWLEDDLVAALQYPYYAETMTQLEAILDQAQRRGVTRPEIASILASLHAQAIAYLRPNDQQRELTVNVFREAVITFQNDLAEISNFLAFLTGSLQFSGLPENFETSTWLAQWLRTPLPALGDERPIALLNTENGRKLVRSVIERIVSGAYS